MILTQLNQELPKLGEKDGNFGATGDLKLNAVFPFNYGQGFENLNPNNGISSMNFPPPRCFFNLANFSNFSWVFSASGGPKFELLPGVLSIVYCQRSFNYTGENLSVFLV